MFRCTLVEEDGRRSVREIAARDREHAHLLALIGGATPVAIVPSAPSAFQRAVAWATNETPERFFVDLAAVVRSGRTVREAIEGLAEREGASQRGDALLAVQARLAAGQGLGPSIRAEMAMPRWIEVALEVEPKRSDERHIAVIATSIDRFSARARDARGAAPETGALVASTLIVLAASGPIGAFLSALTIGAIVFALTPLGPIGCSVAEFRTARFLAILSALLDLGASARRAVDLAADEIGDTPTSVALRAAAAVAPETMPIDRLLAVPINLPAVAALILAGDSLPGDATAHAAAELHTAAVRGIHRALTIARASAIMVLGAVILSLLGR